MANTTSSTVSSTVKHTPGPWAIEPVAATLSQAQNDYLITHESAGLRSHVCRLFDASLCDEHGTTEANARLIAAAPDLLAALESTIPALMRLGDFVGNVDEGGASGLGRIDRCALIGNVRAALARAKGE